MKLCAIDNGFKDTKIKIQNNIYKFPSKIQRTNSNLDTNIIEINGESYTVGSGKDSIQSDKTSNLTHRLCELRALAENMESQEESFNLLLDLPLGHYYNLPFRESFQEYMSQSITLKYNNQIKQIYINKTTIIPQGLAALYANNIIQYKDKVISILDIGGLTIDGCIIENLKPIQDSIFSINLGTLILENKIKTALNQNFLLNIQDYEIPSIINTGIKNIESESKRIIADCIEEYFSILTREMIAKNWSIETLPILGIGGGVLTVKDSMELFFPNYQQSNDPIYDNVKGLYIIGGSMQ